MRFALSAMAATAGVALLGLALFGDPADYLRRAASEWDSPALPAPAGAEPEDGASVATVLALQEEVSRLKDQLAARQARSASVPGADRTAPAPVRSAEPAAPAQEAVPAPPPPPVQAAAPDQPPPEPAPAAAPAQPPPEPAPVTAPAMPRAQAQAPPQPTPPAHPPLPEPAARPPAPAVSVFQPSPPAEPRAPRRESAPAKPAAPRNQPVPPRSEADADDARAVLARLRQAAPRQDRPAAAEHPWQAADVAPPPPPLPAPAPQPVPVPQPSPVLARLIAARTALASGRIEEGRRRLQEAQLDLVFRQPWPGDSDSARQQSTADDVARALEALGGNDVPAGRRYADRAVDELSGAPTRAQAPAGNLAAGYAPAYPPR